MGKVGRNQLCPCGSGRKVKRCCVVRSGPSDVALARAFVAVQRRQALPVIAGCDREEVVELFHEMLDLPERDLSLLVPLPTILTPALERLARVVKDDDGDEIEDAMTAALAQVDTPIVRARLPRAVIAQRDIGRIDEKVAAMALVQPAGRSLS
ncbi:MAG: YecA family protein, partial [Candidatus Dormibacteria bacterium]